MAKMAGAKWSLFTERENSTMVLMEFIMQPKMPLSTEMEAKLKMGLTKSVQELAEELKFYLENGTAHPRKIKSSKN
jgi:hypothetical protein